MVRVYVAGAYSAPDVLSVFANMRLGYRVAVTLLKNGYAPIVPWADFPLHMQSGFSLEQCYEYGLSLMDGAQCVFLADRSTDPYIDDGPVENWWCSGGTHTEIRKASFEIYIPMFNSLSLMNDWRNGEYVQDLMGTTFNIDPKAECLGEGQCICGNNPPIRPVS